MPSRNHGLNSPQLWGSDGSTWAPANTEPRSCSGHPAAAAPEPNSSDAAADSVGLVLLLSVEAAGRALGVCRTKVYELIGRGDLEVVHIDRSARVPVESVHDYVHRLRARRQTRRG